MIRNWFNNGLAGKMIVPAEAVARVQAMPSRQADFLLAS
jgi:hypothetical protein